MLPELPFAFDALEPYFDKETIEIHYSKHHAGYTDKLNTALEKYPELSKKSIEDLLGNLAEVPDEIRTTVRNQGGGYYNHCLFWEFLNPNGALKQGKHNELIEKYFDSMDNFKQEFTNSSLALFGSGWTWLVREDNDKLKILNTSNQDNPIMENTNIEILLGIDIWEHAYYLKYQNRRAEYLEGFWSILA